MKLIKFLIFSLFITFFINCKENKNNTRINNIEITSPDIADGIFNIDVDSAVIFLNPSDLEIEEIKKQKGEDDFFTIADDENNYVANIREILKKQKINTLSTNKKIIQFKSDNTVFDKQQVENKWSILVYKKNKPLRIISSIDLYIELNEFINAEKKLTIDLILNKSENSTILTNENDSASKSTIDLNGIWRVDCANTLTILDISKANAYVSIYSNTVYINAKIHSSENEPNTYYLKFLNQDESSMTEENKIDIKKISKNKDIGIILIVNNKLLKLYWYGLYNYESKTYEYDKNTPFDLESENQKPIELTKCE